MAVQRSRRWVFWAVLSPTAWLRTGIEMSLLCFQHRWEGCCPVSGGLTKGRTSSGIPLVHHLFSCLLPTAAESRAQGQSEQEELRQGVFPKPLRGGELPAAGKWIMAEKAWGHTWLHHTVTHISTYRQSRRTERISQSNWEIWFRVHSTAQAAQSESHWRVSLSCAGIAWLSPGTVQTRCALTSAQVICTCPSQRGMSPSWDIYSLLCPTSQTS